MKAAVDTNILIYAFGLNDEQRYRRSFALMDALSLSGGVVAAQALAEFHRVATRKYGRPSVEATEQIEIWSDVFVVAPTAGDTLAEAGRLANRHALQIFDAIIIAASAQAGCRILLSEDMQHEAVFNGVTIINPFVATDHPLLSTVLK